jgi:hypothetical protein
MRKYPIDWFDILAFGISWIDNLTNWKISYYICSILDRATLNAPSIIKLYIRFSLH